MQSIQSQSAIPQKDYTLWQKYSCTYSSLILPSILIENHISKIFSLVYSLGYQTRYTLFLEVFFEDSTDINQNTVEYFLRNLYNLVTPLTVENPHLDFTVLLPQLTKTKILLARTPAPKLDVVFEHESFSLSQSPYHKEASVTCAVQSLTLVQTELDASAYYSKLDPSGPAKPLKSHNRSCLGGTYDHLHAGHRLFLSFSALVTKDYMLVGLTSDEILTKKTHRSAIQCFETRYESVTKFIEYFDPSLKLDVVEINDPVGPAKDGDFDIIVVTLETLKGGAYVNNLRKEGGYKELEVVVANLVSNTGVIEDKLSSTHLRKAILDKVDGKSEVLEELYKEWNELMESFGVKDKGFIGRWFDVMKVKYCESWRYYHTLTHVWNLLRICNENIEAIQEKDVVKLTVWLHDVIYIPQNPDNEKDSVKLLEDFVSQLEERTKGKHTLTPEKQEKVKKIILYTINHSQLAPEAKEWLDAKFFLDIDLSVLGSDEEEYRKYADNVRKEYSFVAEQTFKEKRAEFMQRFLTKDLEIYKTELFRTMFEEKALRNISAEVKMLLETKVPV